MVFVGWLFTWALHAASDSEKWCLDEEQSCHDLYWGIRVFLPAAQCLIDPGLTVPNSSLK